MAYIYLATNAQNGKRYVGKTEQTIEERWDRHWYDALYEQKTGKPTYFHSALLKYGQSGFNVSQLEQTLFPDEGERHWIAELRPEYNLTAGGTGGDTSQSPNFIAAMTKTSKRMMGNTYRLGKPNPMTETRRQNIIASRTGNPHPHKGVSLSKESRRKISETLKAYHRGRTTKALGTNDRPVE